MIENDTQMHLFLWVCCCFFIALGCALWWAAMNDFIIVSFGELFSATMSILIGIIGVIGVPIYHFKTK
jgi:hypothetical protein